MLEASLVDVVSAGGFAPDSRFAGLEFHEANGTVALDGFSLAILVLGAGGLDSTQG